MATVFRFLVWILFRIQNKKVAMIVNSSTPPMIMPTTAPALKLTSDFVVDNVPINTGTELELFPIPGSFTA